MKTPLELKLDGDSVAEIVGFGYETPWATGKVEFKDLRLFQKLVGVTSMASFDLEIEELGLEDKEEDRMWEAKLSELGLTSQDLKLDHDGRWWIVPNGGKPQPIYSPKFYECGSMNWRL